MNTAVGMDEQRVLVADYHPLARHGLAAALRLALPKAKLIGAGTVAEAETKVRQVGRIHMAIIDPALPDAKGLSALLRLQYIMPKVPLVVLLGQDDDAVAGKARSLGVAGILFKSAPLDQLASGIQDIAAGRFVFPPGALPSDVPPIRDRIARLSDAQRRVLFALTDGRANKRIAYDLAITEATVKAHLTAIFRQLGVTNRAQVMLALQPIVGEATS